MHRRHRCPSDKLIDCSTSALAVKLEQLIDFDRIDAGKEMRLSVGVVKTTGFEQVMASRVLSQSFPPIEIYCKGLGRMKSASGRRRRCSECGWLLPKPVLRPHKPRFT